MSERVTRYVDDYGTSRRLTEKQQAAFDYVHANPSPVIDDVIRVSGVRGYGDNQAMFLLRLLRTGTVRLTIDPEYRED